MLVTVTLRVAVPVAPRSSVTVSRTVYVPGAPYVRLGSRTLELAPSPKLQLQAVTAPSGSVLVSVNPQLNPEQEMPKDASGEALAGGGVSPFTREPSHATYGSVTAANSRLSEVLSISAASEFGVRPLNVATRSSDGTTTTQFCPEPVVR